MHTSEHVATLGTAITEAATAANTAANTDTSTGIETTSTDAATVPAKPSKAERKAARKAAAKAAKSKPVSKPAKAAANAEKPAKAASGDNLALARAERTIAAEHVSTYYNGSSLPFKSAHDTFSPLNSNMQKRATVRQAALIAAMLCADTANNIQPDGTFTRGGFVLRVKPHAEHPSRFVLSRAADATSLHMQPESGCLGDMLNRAVTYVSGPTSGKAQREATFRLNFDIAERELSELLGGDLSRAARKRIAELRKAATA